MIFNDLYNSQNLFFSCYYLFSIDLALHTLIHLRLSLVFYNINIFIPM